jgi:hypothetical protein
MSETRNMTVTATVTVAPADPSPVFVVVTRTSEGHLVRVFGRGVLDVQVVHHEPVEPQP